MTSAATAGRVLRAMLMPSVMGRLGRSRAAVVAPALDQSEAQAARAEGGSVAPRVAAVLQASK